MAGLTIGTQYHQDLSKPSPQPNILGHKLVAVQITFDSSYPTNGEALVASDVGLDSILAVFSEPKGGYNFVWAANLLEAFWVDTTVDGAPLAEVTNTTDLSGVTAWFLILGT
jgi:hypothetical protein